MNDNDVQRLDGRIDRVEGHLDIKLDGIVHALKHQGEQVARIDERTTITNRIGVSLIVAVIVQLLGTLALYKRWL